MVKGKCQCFFCCQPSPKFACVIKALKCKCWPGVCFEVSCIISTTKMALARTFYNTFVKKNSVFVTTIFVSAFAFEVAFDTTTSKVWDNLNKGVSARHFSFLCFQFIHVCMQQDDESISRHISASNGITLVILGAHVISSRHFI